MLFQVIRKVFPIGTIVESGRGKAKVVGYSSREVSADAIHDLAIVYVGDDRKQMFHLPVSCVEQVIAEIQ